MTYFCLESIVASSSDDGCVVYVTQIIEPDCIDYLIAFTRFKFPKVKELEKKFVKLIDEDGYIWSEAGDEYYYDCSNSMSDLLDIMVKRHNLCIGNIIIGRLQKGKF